MTASSAGKGLECSFPFGTIAEMMLTAWRTPVEATSSPKMISGPCLSGLGADHRVVLARTTAEPRSGSCWVARKDLGARRQPERAQQPPDRYHRQPDRARMCWQTEDQVSSADLAGAASRSTVPTPWDSLLPLDRKNPSFVAPSRLFVARPLPVPGRCVGEPQGPRLRNGRTSGCFHRPGTRHHAVLGMRVGAVLTTVLVSAGLLAARG